MTRAPDPAGFRARTLARLRGDVVAAPALSATKSAKRERNTVRNAQRRRALTPWAWKKVLEYWEHRCVYCDRPVADKSMNKDHFIPLKLGGTLAKSNVVPACPKCNRQKHDRHPLEFMTERGLLARYVAIVSYLETVR